MGPKQHMLTPYFGLCNKLKPSCWTLLYLLYICICAIMWLGLSRFYYILNFFYFR